MRLSTTSFALCTLLLLTFTVAAQEMPPGHIAYVDQDYNVWRYDLELDRHSQLTGDSAVTKRYLWPTWSTDGRLAWFSHDVETGGLVTSAWVQASSGAPAVLLLEGEDAFNYAFWSPGNCQDGPQCRHLAILLSSQSRGMFVELVADGAGETQEGKVLRGGPPFYFSWSPEGSRLLLQRNNRRFDVYDADEDRILATLDQRPGLIQAPHWSPVDDRLLLGARQGDGRTALVLLDGAESMQLEGDLTGGVAFNWSPDGRHVAWREQTVDGYGVLKIAEASSGELVTGSLNDGVVAFVWAPDGSKIAWLEFVVTRRNPGTQASNSLLAQRRAALPGLRWRVLEIDGGAIHAGPSFYPTRELLYYVSYFDQFAQSHRLWSPDSRFLVYGELRDDGPVVQVLDSARPGESPATLAAGWMGIWSFGAP